jgi:hypothetical protein
MQYWLSSMILMLTLSHAVASPFGVKIPNPEGKITIKVIDEDTGEPIKGAKAIISFKQATPAMWEPRYDSHSGITDNNGMCILTGHGASRISCGAQCDGYYRTGFNYQFDEIGSLTQTKHTPWNPKVVVKLRKIKNPVAMYAKRVREEIPAIDSDVGFDLVIGDWVPPYGKGKINDFVIYISKRYESNANFEARLQLGFSNQHDGIIAVAMDQDIGSNLRIPHLAPKGGYQSELIKFQSRDPESRQTKSNVDSKQHYYFRIRSKIEDDGTVVGLYGKIYNDIQVLPYKLQSKLPKVAFSYYLNPDGTRNTEFASNQNLFEGLTGIAVLNDP